MILASTPRPNLLWEPAQGLANPFVFSANVATVAQGDIMQWDHSNASGRCYSMCVEVIVIPTTEYVQSTLTVTSATAFPSGQDFDTSGYVLGLAEMIITQIGSLVDVAVGDKFSIDSTTTTTIVLDAPGLGVDNDGVANDWQAEIVQPLDARHPLGFWTPTPALAITAGGVQKRKFYGVAEKSVTLPPVVSVAAGVDFPRIPITMSGLTQVLCDTSVLAGDFLIHSTATASTAQRLTAPATNNSVPVFAKALEDAPSGGGLTWCLFDGFYGFGCTHDPY